MHLLALTHGWVFLRCLNLTQLSLQLPPTPHACPEIHTTSPQALNRLPIFWWPCQEGQGLTNAPASPHTWLGIFEMSEPHPTQLAIAPNTARMPRNPYDLTPSPKPPPHFLVAMPRGPRTHQCTC